jgi:FlaA1/EpsC-like NDP-sugar epimerase
VLVTGAGGSIGSELCRQIAESRPAELMMLDRYENALYFTHRELADAHPSLGLQPVIGDVTDETRVNQVLSQFRPQVVFHAAAHKHVPLMEDNPSEAVKNNVRGTRVMAEAAARHGVERFVLISTDKAVNPTSVMGAAKRVAEMLVTSFNGHSPTHFVAVRFGNVLASNGSVVPLFLSQIAKGGPVTVTHPEMRRYFMLIPEAVQLVLQAAAIGEDGDILVLDMGEQVKVAEMARDLIRLAGFIPDKDIEIAYTGVRPGEKLYEELVGADEHAEPSAVPKVLKIVSGVGNRPPSPRLWRPAEASSEGGESGVGRESGLDRDSQTDQRATPAHPAHLNGLLHALEQAALDGRDDDVIAHLCRIVPGFTPQARPLR